MKVLQINSVCGTGSTGRIATDIHHLLTKSGHESAIAYGRGDAKNCNWTIKIGRNKDVLLHIVKTRLLDRHGFGSKKATEIFVKKVRDFNPDIIHLHNIHGYYLHIGVLFDFLKDFNKPVVWTLHDCWPFSGHSAFIDKPVEEKAIASFSDLRKYPKSLFINNSRKNLKEKKRIFSGVDNLTIVTPSKWLAELVEESFLKQYPVKIINNGIDLDIFKPVQGDFRKRNNIEDKFMILGVANIWEERKGLKYFLDLAGMLGDDSVIVLVGVSEKQKAKLPKNIIGITRTNNAQELVGIYSTADVFVNPTLEDNFPTTNIEALACGTPVITFDTGGSGESVGDGCGRVVPRGNLNQLLDAIKDIKAHGKAKFEKQCIRHVQKHFNKYDKYQEYILLYGEKIQ